MKKGSAAERGRRPGESTDVDERSMRMYNLRAFLASIGVALGLGLVITSSIFAEMFDVKASLVLAGASALAAAGTAQIVSLYLRGKLSFGTVTTVTVSTAPNPAQGELLVALDLVREALKKVSHTSPDQNLVIQRETDQRLISSREIFTDARRRLSEQVIMLERRARVNLVTGSSTTVGAVAILLAFAFSPTYLVELSWQQLLSLYLPKLGVVLMLEVFAFFFLRLYKASLEDSRALHADLDMLALKEAALIAAWVDDAEHRLETARLLVTQGCRNDEALAAPKDVLDPKTIAELVAVVTKIVRGQ